MDFIKELLSARGAGMLSQLIGSGFDAEQAQVFLPEAGDSIMEALKHADLASLLKSEPSTQTLSLIDTIDVRGLAERAGIDSALARNGLENLVPMAMGFLKANDALAGLMGLAGDKSGVIAGVAKRLLH